MPTMMRDAAISFPMLGNLTLNFPASFSFTLFDHEFTIYLYGIVMAIAFLAAVFYASRRAPRVGIKSDDIFSLVLWVLPIAIVGCRIYYVISEWDRFKDDLVSMLPFRNYLCYVALKGEDLTALFEGMADGNMQCFGGAEVVLDGDRLDTLLVGGLPVDPEKVYGVATIDFLLDGGDRINVAKNAKELIITDVKVIDSMLPYAMSYAERGDSISYFADDRLVVRGK